MSHIQFHFLHRQAHHGPYRVRSFDSYQEAQDYAWERFEGRNRWPYMIMESKDFVVQKDKWDTPEAVGFLNGWLARDRAAYIEQLGLKGEVA